MWAFDGSVDVDADVQIMLECRSELHEIVKAVEKVSCVGRGSPAFMDMRGRVESLCGKAKEQCCSCMGW